VYQFEIAIDGNSNGNYDIADTKLTDFAVHVVPKSRYATNSALINQGWKAAISEGLVYYGIHVASSLAAELLDIFNVVDPLPLASSILAAYMGEGAHSVIKPDFVNPAVELLSTSDNLELVAGANFVPLDPNYDVCRTLLNEYVYTSPEVSDMIANSKTVENWYKKKLKKDFSCDTLVDFLIHRCSKLRRSTK